MQASVGWADYCPCLKFEKTKDRLEGPVLVGQKKEKRVKNKKAGWRVLHRLILTSILCCAITLPRRRLFWNFFQLLKM